VKSDVCEVAAKQGNNIANTLVVRGLALEQAGREGTR